MRAAVLEAEMERKEADAKTAEGELAAATTSLQESEARLKQEKHDVVLGCFRSRYEVCKLA